MADGERISISGGTLRVPDRPVVPYVEGDGTGRDIWRASQRVFDAAVEKTYGGRRKIAWLEVLAGEKAFNATGEWMPAATLAGLPRLPGRHQGAADHAGGGRDPLPERRPAAGARPLRLPAPRALLRRACRAR